ncbi:MAG TPA: hypothetical protein DIC53_05985, partial [Synergistaceae bacterium]|nr:hypothetical protein [Synergistaceae bacterium]
MGSCVVLCDDLTGSSVQSILLKDRGLQVRQIIRLDGGELPLPSDGEALVVNCDTRRRPRDEALSIVRRVLRSLPGETRVGKRIDTTLRGHLAAETDAILAARPRATALVVPAYPASGRTTVGGYQLLDGVLIERTEVSKDPSWPIGESFVPAFFGGDRAVALLPMERVRGGPEAIAAELERFMGTGHRIVVADAMTDQDIESVAAGACMVDGEIVPVDPGPMTAAFFSRLGSGADSGGLVLVVVGTLSEWTRSQVAYLNGRTETVEYTLSPDDDDAIPAAFGELLARRDRPKAVILRTPATLRKGAGGD